MKKTKLILHSTALACLGLASSVNAADNRINQALSANGGVATQKDNPFSMPAPRGNDGLIVTDSNFAHTSNADNEWWEVRLSGTKTIAEVRLWLRNDAIYGSRDSNLRLTIYSDTNHASVVYSADLPDGTVIPVPYRNITHTLPTPVFGQVVRIEHPTGIADYLQINEVQVFNQVVEEVNLALTGFASMSSQYSTYVAQRAVDGFNDGVTGAAGNGSTAHTAGTEDPLLPWWQVDLGSEQKISAIRVFTSANTTLTRNDDLAVVVLDSAYSVISSNYNAVHPPTVTLSGHDFPNNKQYLLYTFDPPLVGQTVQVSHTMTNAGFLVLPEVEVLKAYTNTPTINIAQGPTNKIVDVFSSVTMSVVAGVSGANANYLSYQWQSNGVNIAGAIGTTYTTPSLGTTGDITYSAKMTLPGLTVSTQAVISVIPDVIPPAVVTNWFTALSDLRMTVVYNELVQPATVTNANNYVFAGGASVGSMTMLGDGKSVSFVVNGLLPYDDYLVTISGVKDLSGNTIATTNLIGRLPAYQINYALGGTATARTWNVSYPPVRAIDNNLNTDNNFYHSEYNVAPLDNEYWEVNLGSPRSIGEIKIYFRTRPTYQFRDTNLVVTVMDTNRTLVYSNFLGDSFPPQPTDLLISPAVTGQIVRVEHPVGVFQVLTLTEVQVLPTPGGLAISAEPKSQAVVTNGTASFSVTAVGVQPISYQWRLAGNNIPGATNATLVISTAGPAQAGEYICVVSNSSRVRFSQPATLTLLPPAVVHPLLLVRFNGALSDSTYSLGAGEVDITGTFAPLVAGQTISNGMAVLDCTAAIGQGFSVTNNIVDQGSGTATNFVAEMLFIPTPEISQGIYQEAGLADFFSIGSTHWLETRHGDGVFALRYSNPTNYQMQVDSVGSSGTVTGTNLPATGVANHIAIVYTQGAGMTNNVLDYYLNGSKVSSMVLANNVGSSGVGSVYATFGQNVALATGSPHGIDGLLDAVAYATFSGVFTPGVNFQLYTAPAAPVLTIADPKSGNVVVTWGATGFVLQQKSDLNGWTWTDVPGSSPVSLPVGSGNKFFRLRQQ